MNTRNQHEPRTPNEEAWSRWDLVDQLASLGRCDEAVRAQQELLDWARDALTPDRLLWVMSGEAPARCWMAVGRHEEWLAIFRELLGRVPRQSANRLQRLDYLRTAGLVLVGLGHRDDALRVAGMMRDLAEEEPGWPRALWPQIEARVLELRLHDAAGDRVAMRRDAAAIAPLLERSGQAVEASRVRELLAYVRGILEDLSK